jgi:hypothetical protein
VSQTNLTRSRFCESVSTGGQCFDQ